MSLPTWGQKYLVLEVQLFEINNFDLGQPVFLFSLSSRNWDKYVNYLCYHPDFDHNYKNVKALICDEDGKVISVSSGFDISHDELMAFITKFSENDFFDGGLTIEGRNYTFHSFTDKTLIMKREFSRENGLIIHQTLNHFILTKYQSPILLDIALNVSEEVAHNFKINGF